MTDAWYEGASPEEEKLYEASVRKIKDAVGQGLTFGQAVGLVDIKDEALKASIAEDALKVLLAEMHFAGGKTLEEVAKALAVPIKRLQKSKAEMLKEVEAQAIEAYKEEMRQKGEA